MAKRKKFIQIIAAQRESGQGRQFSLLALDEDGVVWRYLVGESRWDSYPTHPLSRDK